jgi:hypothetical protein
MRHDRPFLIVRHVLAQAFGGELDLAGIGAQILRPVGAAPGVAGVRGVDGSAFGKPAQAGGRLVVIGNGDDVVAFFVEFLPGNLLGDVGGLEEEFRPVVLGVALGIEVLQGRALGQQGEDFVVGFGFAQRFDAFLLATIMR